MKKAVMYGAGNIGRGFIGQLFSQSGYQVVFIDVAKEIVNRLNSDNKYPVRVVSREGYDENIVDNVRGVNGLSEETVSNEIKNCDLMATAVGVNVLEHIAKPLAMGLIKRWEDGNLDPLNIIICENLLDANHFLKRLIKTYLNSEQKKLFDNTIGLVEASIGRMVPVMTDEMKEGNPLRVWVEPYNQLPVDKKGFKGDIPDVKNMVPYSPFDYYVHRKLFMHNMGHALTAYLGFMENYTYIWEAVDNPYIKLFALRALLESSAAMSREHKASLDKLLEHSDDLIYRFGNRLLGDTVKRVGKDPVRKLSLKDRLGGSCNLCINNGILPVYISAGIGAGFIFNNPQDTASLKIKSFIDEYGIEKAIEKFCEISSISPAFSIITRFYNLFKEGNSLKYVLSEAEKIKNS